jgi:hypothetical protein
MGAGAFCLSFQDPLSLTHAGGLSLRISNDVMSAEWARFVSPSNHQRASHFSAQF